MIIFVRHYRSTLKMEIMTNSAKMFRYLKYLHIEKNTIIFTVKHLMMVLNSLHMIPAIAVKCYIWFRSGMMVRGSSLVL